MSERKERNRKAFIKNLARFLFFAVLTVFAIYYILKDDPKKTASILGQTQFFPFSLAIVVLLLTICIDGVSLTLLTRMYNKNYRFGQGILNTMISGAVSVYVKTVAPVLQAHTFEKQGVVVTEAASVLTMNFLLYQISLTLYSVVIVICGYPIMQDVPLSALWGLKIFYLILVGLSIQVIFILATVLIAYCRPLHRFVVDKGISFLAKLHIIKDPEERKNRLSVQLATYRIEMKRLSQNLPLVFKVLVLNFVRLFLLGIIPFIIFCSLSGGTLFNSQFFAQSLVSTGYTNVIGSFFTVGVPEIVFQDTFSYFLKDVVSDPASMASACNILWRTTSFYLVFLIGIITWIAYHPNYRPSKLLSDTKTIYDIELLNPDAHLKENQIQPKNKMTMSQLESSFMRLKRAFAAKEDKEGNEPPVEINETEFEEAQKAELAKAYSEFSELKEQVPSDAEVQEEIAIGERKKAKKLSKKEERKRKKRLAKEEKEFLKHQPLGTTIKVDDENGIQINVPEFIEMKTDTTSDPEENKKDSK